MEKLKIFQTYYKEEQYIEYLLNNNPSFVECINTNTYKYPHSELNPFWSEFIFMKYVYEHIDDYDCEYIGFDQYKCHFNYEEVLPQLDGSDKIFINKLEKANLYHHYCISHNKEDIDNLVRLSNFWKDRDGLEAFWKQGVVNLFWGSCFIMKKETFKELGDFLFRYLDTLDKLYCFNYDVDKYVKRFTEDFNKNNYDRKVIGKYRTYEYQRRAFGYLAERLLSSWVVIQAQKVSTRNIVLSKLCIRGKDGDVIPKNILLMSHELTLTGAPRALLNLAKALKSLGHTVIIISPVGGKLESEIKASGIRVAIDSKFESRLQTKEKYSNILMEWADVIVCNTIVTAKFLPYMKDYKAKKILWVHEGVLAYKSFKYNWKTLFPYADEVFTVGKYSNLITEATTGTKCGILNYFIDDDYDKDRKKPEKNDDKIRIGIIGTISRRKGHHLLPNAIKSLPQEIKDRLEIHVIGKEGSKTTSSMLRDSSLPQIKIIGEMEHKGCLDYIQLMDAVMTPSIDDPMPICNTEALMYHIPIITSINTGTAGYIEDGKNGFIVGTTSESIADGIKRFVEARDKWKEIGDNGRKVFDEYFTKETFLQNIHNIF